MDADDRAAIYGYIATSHMLYHGHMKQHEDPETAPYLEENIYAHAAAANLYGMPVVMIERGLSDEQKKELESFDSGYTELVDMFVDDPDDVDDAIYGTGIVSTFDDNTGIWLYVKQVQMAMMDVIERDVHIDDPDIFEIPTLLANEHDVPDALKGDDAE